MRHFADKTVKAVTAAAAATVLAGTMAGCAQINIEITIPEDESKVTVEIGTEEAAADAGTSAETEAETAAEDENVFAQFLAGNGTVSWASYLESGDPEADYNWQNNYGEFFDAEDSYTFDEFADGVVSAGAALDGLTGDAADAQYAVLDLGGTGAEALALKFPMKDQGDGETDTVFILTDNGDEGLGVALVRTSDRMTTGVLDDYGFYYEYGQTAGLQGISVETVDADGVYHFLYGAEDLQGIYMLTQDDAVFKDAEEAGIQMSILGRHVVTDRSGFSDPESGAWNYYRLDENGMLVYDAGIYEEGSDYKKVWDEIGHERTDDQGLYKIELQNCVDNGMDEQFIAEHMIIRTPDTDSSADEVSWSSVKAADIAAENESEISAEGPVTYEGDGWTITYDPDKFFLFEGREEGDPVQLSYQGDAAGSDVISVEVTDFTSNQDCIDALNTYNFEIVTESEFGGYASLTATTGAVSAGGSELTTDDTFISVDKDGKIYLIEIFETVEPEEEDAYRVGGDIENTLDSIQFN